MTQLQAAAHRHNFSIGRMLAKIVCDVVSHPEVGNTVRCFPTFTFGLKTTGACGKGLPAETA
jgi:hypothetical protein